MQLLPKPIQPGPGWVVPSEDSIKRKKLYWNLICLGIEGGVADNDLLEILLTMTNSILELKREKEKE